VKLQRHQHLLAGIVLAAGAAVVLAGCMGSKEASSTTSSLLRPALVVTTAESVADAGQELVVSGPDAYSSFQSKDPFIQQQVMTTEGATNTSQTSYSPPPSSTTTTAPSNTTTSSTSTTSTSSTTSTTSFFTHMLQVLAVGVVADAPAVTFQVDNTVYQDQRIGSSVSTSWGNVQVVGINTDIRVATLLHDGQTLTMTVGQILFE
jgi:hypothetical protein